MNFKQKKDNFETNIEYQKFATGKHKQSKTSLRLVAFLAVVFSTFALTVCLFIFPFIFYYAQELQAHIQGEVEYCKIRSNDIWQEMVNFELDIAFYDKKLNNRGKRSTLDSVCCTCQQGPPGIDGPPGLPGKDGAPGEGPGEPGSPGKDAEINDKILPIPPQCPCKAPRGPIGPPGPPGNDGQPGSIGKSGKDGIDGLPGLPGPIGPPGQTGQPGQRGLSGKPGILVPSDKLLPGPPGPLGRPGQPGVAGKPGAAGKDGKDGAPGPIGEIGQKGPPGPNGSPGIIGAKGKPGLHGSCDHCPPARLAPGY